MLEIKGQYSEIHLSKICEAKGKKKQKGKATKQEGKKTDSLFEVQTEKEEHRITLSFNGSE